ncbi:hypothetical protein [Sphingobacterium lactis]|uniref:Uncharacterized protein n=1 Tax=Sphingobacterium lactis TaxID=797291 RepID=A0A1H6BPL8_9SPHI|nr:hypothetical protein [Sphingobacterium lactis]SEG62624.1 hypothetical protein SAMN05421877_11143 [Sphingobacterium lactis]
MKLINNLDKKLRETARNLIDNIEPENVDAVVDSILTDMYGGASSVLEEILLNIDDSMGYYEIAEIIRELRVEIGLKLMGYE